MLSGGVLYLEQSVAPSVRLDLLRRGHVLQDAPPGVFGGYQAVARNPETGVLSGATEWRKDGCAIGY